MRTLSDLSDAEWREFIDQVLRERGAEGPGVIDDAQLSLLALRLERYRKSDVPLDRFRALASTILRNLRTDEARRAGRERKGRDELARRTSPANGAAGRDPELKAVLVRVLQTLGDDELEIVRRRILGEQKLREIAEDLGVAITTVHDRYARAIRAIRAGILVEASQSPSLNETLRELGVTDDPQ